MTGWAAAPADALRAARMCAIDPGLGGMVLRGSDSERAAVIETLKGALPAGTPVRRLPVNVREDDVDGSIDLAAALSGRLARRGPGMLDVPGLLIVPMAERLAPPIAARIAAAIDRGLIVVALDDGAGDRPPSMLVERLAFRFDLDRVDDAIVGESGPPVTRSAAIELLAAAAAALGASSVRADLMALRAAGAAATLAGRAGLHESDLADAARLVLAPRATRLPADAEAAAPPPARQSADTGEADGDFGQAADRLIAAAQAAIDPALLAVAEGAVGRRGTGAHSRGPGERRRTLARGRPVGSRAGDPRNGGRLALIETLRAAAPWQRLRGRTDRVLVRKADLRVHRREARAEAVVIFAVDASGSAAMARMGEAKGAVELLLNQAYVQRAQVALAAFRGTEAAVLLPPTRSLARARRALAELPGGGGTPLADGIQAALGIARTAQGRGQTPLVVMLSDGRANLAAGGISAGRAAAERDAVAAARLLRAEQVSSIFVDTGARQRAEGARVAEAMGARYVPLPFAGPAGLKAVVDAFTPHRS